MPSASTWKSRRYLESNCILFAALEHLCLQEQEPRCRTGQFFLVTLGAVPLITHYLYALPLSIMCLQACVKS